MRHTALFRGLALAGLAAGTAAAETRAAPADWPRVYIDDARTAAVVRSALVGASRRLAVARCQDVFSDFSDEQGRPLNVRLAELNQTGPGYLPWLVVLDGSEMPQCRRGATYAFTGRGFRTIYVCGRRFARAVRANRVSTEIVLIHEALHSLGLGENPPSSQSISHQIRRRCW